MGWGRTFVCLSLLLVGCNASPPSEAPVAVGVQQSSSEAKTVTPKITWSANVDARALGSLGDADARARVTRSPVPVLAPTNVTLERPTFIVEAEYYALTGRVQGATIAIQGTRAQKRYDSIAPVQGDRTLRGQHGFVSTNEGIRTSSWMENGAAYSVDIECADTNDTRCTGEAFLLAIVESLANAGGAGK